MRAMSDYIIEELEKIRKDIGDKIVWVVGWIKLTIKEEIICKIKEVEV